MHEEFFFKATAKCISKNDSFRRQSYPYKYCFSLLTSLWKFWKMLKRMSIVYKMHMFYIKKIFVS